MLPYATLLFSTLLNATQLYSSYSTLPYATLCYSSYSTYATLGYTRYSTLPYATLRYTTLLCSTLLCSFPWLMIRHRSGHALYCNEGRIYCVQGTQRRNCMRESVECMPCDMRVISCSLSALHFDYRSLKINTFASGKTLQHDCLWVSLRNDLGDEAEI